MKLINLMFFYAFLCQSALAVTQDACQAEQNFFMDACLANYDKYQHWTHGDRVKKCQPEITSSLGLANASRDLDDAKKAIRQSERWIDDKEAILESLNQRPCDARSAYGIRCTLDTRGKPDEHKHDIARNKMHICFTMVRYQEMSGGAQPPKDVVCEESQSRAVNQELAQIEERLSGYLSQKSMQEVHNIVPDTRVVMWATQKIKEVILRNCSGADLFLEKSKDMQRDYNKTLEVCKAVARDPNICTPMAP